VSCCLECAKFIPPIRIKLNETGIREIKLQQFKKLNEKVSE
jgi:hypothetical protein